ncbi:hypothetical protein ACWKWP_04335 [Agromyces soli]
MTQTPPATRRSTRLAWVWAVAAVAIGVPLVLWAWIGLILLGEQLELGLTANEVLAWLIAAVVALGLWPLAIRGSHRQLWHFRDRRPGEKIRWGAEPTAPVPRVRWAAGELLARVAIIVIGAILLFAICGPQQVTLALAGGLDAISAGTRSWWGALQLVAFVLTFALALPVLWLSERRLRGIPRDDPEYARRAVVQNWYYAAALAWGMSALLGFLFGFMILRYL